jgi:hypothetical protein
MVNLVSLYGEVWILFMFVRLCGWMVSMIRLAVDLWNLFGWSLWSMVRAFYVTYLSSFDEICCCIISCYPCGCGSVDCYLQIRVAICNKKSFINE